MRFLRKFVDVLKDRNMWLFFGSGLIVSTAYIDPGNWGTNIGSGSEFNYQLLWVIWMASGMAMMFQYLSGKLGIAGYSLPDLVRVKLKKPWKIYSYWLLSEIVVLATDLAEFLGIVVALNLLFGIPLLWGSFIAVFDVLLIMFLVRKKFRNLEKMFVVFVSLVGLSFLYEVLLAKPDISLIAFHSFTLMLSAKTAILAVGIIGATVMPHALFVHSWLIKNKVISTEINDVKKTLKYHLIDTVSSLFIAAFINAAMLIMAAAAFYSVGEVATLTEAYKTLIPLFGNFAAIVFALALLSAGISSSITGTLAGQSIMDGLVGFRMNMWIRRLITRILNLIPIVVAILLNIEPLSMLIWSQVALSLLIPLPLIPLLMFTSDKKIMGELVNKKTTTVLASIFALVILAFNFYLLYSFFFMGVSL